MYRKMMTRALGAAGFTAVLAVSAVWAQDAPVRVRGTIEGVDGETISIKSREGAAVKVKLADNAVIAAVVNASLSDIKQGNFVGVTALPETDGSWRAVEVHIFPESMRGTGEGDRAWDLQPKSTMTNATVNQMVSQVDGQTLTLQYKGGEKKIVVPKSAAIVTYAAGDKNDLKPGTKIFIAAATKQADGTLVAPRINVGRNGVAPPM